MLKTFVRRLMVHIIDQHPKTDGPCGRDAHDRDEFKPPPTAIRDHLLTHEWLSRSGMAASIWLKSTNISIPASIKPNTTSTASGFPQIVLGATPGACKPFGCICIKTPPKRTRVRCKGQIDW